MKYYIPKTNDLIIFTNQSSAILSDSDPANPNYRWSESIVTIEPNQSALVLHSYIIQPNKSPKELKDRSHHDNLLSTAIELTQHHKPHIPSPPTLLVISLSNLILETLFDPDLIHPFPHPSNRS